MASTEYPKAMYKGERESAEYRRVHSLDEEQALRDEGFVSGHEFFSPKPEVVPEPAPVVPPVADDDIVSDTTASDNA